MILYKYYYIVLLYAVDRYKSYTLYIDKQVKSISNIAIIFKNVK